MPLLSPIPSAFLAGTASAAGIGLVSSIGNLGGSVGPDLPIWTQAFTSSPSAPLYVIAAVLVVGAGLMFFLVPATSAQRDELQVGLREVVADREERLL